MKEFSLLLFIVCFSLCHAFYQPGLAPLNYCRNDGGADKANCETEVKLFVNRLNSEESVIPYDYTYFDFCTSEDGDSETPVENLGQIVFGERIMSSPYRINFLEPRDCSEVCSKKYDLSSSVDMQKVDKLKKAMSLNYHHHWIVDNMPVTWCYQVQGDHTYCATGFSVGCYVGAGGVPMGACVIDASFKSPETYYIFNHIELNITYHNGREEEEWGGINFGLGQILSVRATPKSIKHTAARNQVARCTEAPPMEIPAGLKGNLEITYSYSVYFTMNNNIQWSSRWDYILDSMPFYHIQWISILNSLEIVLLLSAVVAMIMLRTLHKDIARYNQATLIDAGEDSQKECGWKLVHEDVFRPPRKGMLLSIIVGSGVQVFSVALITSVFTCLGFLSPNNRGSLMTCVLVLYACLGSLAGYTSARLYKSFGGEKWKSNAFLTSMLCPGLVFGVFFMMNLILANEQSSAAVPFSTLITLLALWFLVSVPLTLVGAFFGFRKRMLENPVRTNKIPRQIPEQSIYTQALPCSVMGGVMPFTCICIQLFFILDSIWSSQTYYMFGFLFLAFLILCISCSESTILLCYFHLCAEDYHWWWRSYLTSGFTAFYIFIYSVYYFLAKLNISGFVSTLLYFGYTIIMAFLFFLLTGTIGFCACFWFVRKIYSAVKPTDENRDHWCQFCPSNEFQHSISLKVQHAKSSKNLNSAY